MAITKQTRDRARAVAEKYAGVTSEKSHSAHFVRDFVEMFGVTHTEAGLVTEAVLSSRYAKGKKFADGLIPGKLGFEMKSGGEDLEAAWRQVDERYVTRLPKRDQPDVWVVSDFARFEVRDVAGNIHPFALADLPKHLDLFDGLFNGDGAAPYAFHDAGDVTIEAARLVGDVIRALHVTRYPETDRAQMAARILFCLWADDNGVFAHNTFMRIIEGSKADGSDIGRVLEDVWDILNTESRVDVGDTLLRSLPYVNGGMFADRIAVARQADTRVRSALLAACEFDWSKINTNIIGNLYESAMEPGDRADRGMHYTHEQDILDVLNPLFLNEYRERMGRANTPGELRTFLAKLGEIRVLDSACGSGNFLLVAYREMRVMETAALVRYRAKTGETYFRHVRLEQMHGIEYAAVSAALARTLLWMQLIKSDVELNEALDGNVLSLPFTEYANVMCGNSATAVWPEAEYIVGNPPYLGADQQDEGQRAERRALGIKGGKMDYAHIWMVKAAQALGSRVTRRVGYVVTDSLCAGTQVRGLWSHPAMADVCVVFGRQSYVWPGAAAVRVVNIGLGWAGKPEAVGLWNEAGVEIPTAYITPYLAPSGGFCNTTAASQRAAKEWLGVTLKAGGSYYDSRKAKPGVPGIPGAYSKLSPEDLVELQRDHSEMLIRKLSSVNLLSGEDDWVLWWENATPEARKHPVVKRLRAQALEVRRELKSLAGVPELELAEWMPKNATHDGVQMAIPAVYSKTYARVPIVAVDGLYYCNSKVYSAQMDWFVVGILMSKRVHSHVHATAGRMGTGGDIQFGTGAVYGMDDPRNDTSELRAQIAAAAQACMEARHGVPAADCMKVGNMPAELARAHAALDAAVEEWWG